MFARLLTTSSLSGNPESEVRQPREMTAVESAHHFPSKAPHDKMSTAYHGSNGKKNGLTGNKMPLSSFAENSYQLTRAVVCSLLVEQCVHQKGYGNGVVGPEFSDPDMRRAYSTLMSACRNFLSQHNQELTERVRDLDISDSLLCSSYHQALNKIFEDNINWGRIVAMFCFTEALAYRVHSEGLPPRTIESLINWQKDFIVEYLQEWITKQKGWVSCGMASVCLQCDGVVPLALGRRYWGEYWHNWAHI